MNNNPIQFAFTTLQIFMKILMLYMLKFSGLFFLTKRLYKKKLIILAYHGVSEYDESKFLPDMFIDKSTLKERLLYLKNNKFNAISLNNALDSLETDSLPPNSFVVTVDDGWYSTRLANELFRKHNIPYTLYVTSYYVYKKIPVLNMALRYMAWYCGEDKFISKCHELLCRIESMADVRGAAGWKACDLSFCLKKINELKSTENKLNFIINLSKLLDFDFMSMVKKRTFNLLTPLELTELSQQGTDIQLHTHRHLTPNNDNYLLDKEIEENREHLARCTTGPFVHFCYPSGQYEQQSSKILQGAGVISATTCEPGFVSKCTNRYYLPRFLDGKNIHQIVFEAEVCGVLDIARNLRRKYSRNFLALQQYLWVRSGAGRSSSE